MSKLSELAKTFSKYSSSDDEEQMAFIAYKLAKKLFDSGIDDAATHALQCGETVLKRQFGGLYGQEFFNIIRRGVLKASYFNPEEFNNILNEAKRSGNVSEA